MSIHAQKHRRGGVTAALHYSGIRKNCENRGLSLCASSYPGRISAAGSQSRWWFSVFQASGMKLIGKVPGLFKKSLLSAPSGTLPSTGWCCRFGSPGGKPSRKALQPEAQSHTAAENAAKPAHEASPDTLRRYMQSPSGSNNPLMVTLGDRLNGRMHSFQKQLLQEAEVKKQLAQQERPKQRKQAPGQRRRAPSPSTMEQWLEAADKEKPGYWQKIKAEKES